MPNSMDRARQDSKMITAVLALPFLINCNYYLIRVPKFIQLIHNTLGLSIRRVKRACAYKRGVARSFHGDS